MNDSELRQKLAAWQIPPSSQAARSRAEWHTLTAFRNRGTRSGPPGSPLFYFPKLAVISAVLLVAASTLFFLQPVHHAQPLQNSAPLLAELEEFFQGRLAAAIQHNGSLDLQLAEEPMNRPPDQRVAVRIAVRDESFVILTYSGQSVCLETGAGRICVTPLINGAGEVILLGESGLLEHQAGLRTEAHLLQGI